MAEFKDVAGAGRSSRPHRTGRPLRMWGDYLAQPLAALTLIFMLPLFLLIAFLVVLQDGGPVLFRHRRIGMGGKPFDCLKFRTMGVASEHRLQELLTREPAARSEWIRTHKLRRDPRVTPLGRFLRKASLDELPQLINIIRGDMTLVGPRPIVEAEIPLFGVHFRHYCAVRPGITGLWQVSGRNNLSFRRRVVLDVAYVRAKCLRLDLTILAKTIPVVLWQRGSY
jgi:lipopolysaccharide/colanic/teichoic acid biosynthesis glycosyltransferase